MLTQSKTQDEIKFVLKAILLWKHNIKFLCCFKTKTQHKITKYLLITNTVIKQYAISETTQIKPLH